MRLLNVELIGQQNVPGMQSNDKTEYFWNSLTESCAVWFQENWIVIEYCYQKTNFCTREAKKRLHDITESCKVELARNSMKTVSVLGWKYDMKVGSKAYPFATLVV